MKRVRDKLRENWNRQASIAIVRIGDDIKVVHSQVRGEPEEKRSGQDGEEPIETGAVVRMRMGVRQKKA